jgi:carbon monoxide dehydrogenase subunit G
MLISNTFNVPLPPEETWNRLMDIPSIVPCMPGAELTAKVDNNTYKGKVSVKLGPVALSFNGVATFEERDETARTATVKAQGTDAKGRGGANAVVTFRLEPIPTGSKIDITTNVDLSGSIAQYGRGVGMIQNVANQLISQFAKSLEKQINATRQTIPASSMATPVTDAVVSAAPTAEVSMTAPTRPIAPPSPAKPISGFTLLMGALWASIVGLFCKRKT